MVARRELTAPCVFMHVPKCGGTSLSEALYALVPLNRKIGVLDSRSIRRALALYHAGVDDRTTFHDEGEHAATVADFREQILLMYMAHDCALIHGHFLFSERAFAHFGDSYRYVSILRDPLGRTVSNYRMAHRRGVFCGDFDAFLDSSMGRRMAQHTLRFFSGRADVIVGEEAQAVEAAKANMRRFTVLGFIDELDAFNERFADAFGAKPSVGHVNRAGEGAIEITADQRRRLEALCASDIELTDHARQIA